MSGTDVMALLAFFLGVALVLGEVRVLTRSSLVRRLSPYSHPEAPIRSGGRAPLVAVMSPLADAFGNRLARATGIRTELGLRMERAGRAGTAAEFRLMQFTHSLVAFAAAGAVALAVRPGPVVAVLIVLGTPVLVAMLVEQRLEADAQGRAATTALELPVVAEQLGILLGAGFSLNAALERLSRRSAGVVGSELTRVVREIRSGRAESDALGDWARRAGSDGVSRLVAVLAMHRDASDLGALISGEARAIRSGAHRELVESIEKKSQLVWIPVTVATLVPGLILIGVPFVSAMSQVTG